jgi:hypothetical protein
MAAYSAVGFSGALAMEAPCGVAVTERASRVKDRRPVGFFFPSRPDTLGSDGVR